eukprot:TRINITY_DN5239_c0_g2_i3.p1 TRINITY_DN5239_c0_g2~~TRINITY_DN5239_c0_g2_i3.p1  ORF type:complete len:382 (+),score=93.32 TRINITY_DN5239_c0_g2_i3:1-1146(+)
MCIRDRYMGMREKGVFKEVLVLENLPSHESRDLLNLRMSLDGLGILAADTVEYDRGILGLEKAVATLLQGRIFTENLENAEALRRSKAKSWIKSIVTADGILVKKNVISASGKPSRQIDSYSQGTSTASAEDIARLKKEIEQNQKSILASDSTEEEERVRIAVERLTEVDAKSRIANETKERLAKEIEANSSALRRKTEDLSKLEEERDRLERQQREAEMSVNRCDKALREAEKSVFGPFCEKLGVGSIQEVREFDLREFEELNLRRDRAIANLQELRGHQMLTFARLGKANASLRDAEDTRSRQELQLNEWKKRLDGLELERTELLSKAGLDESQVTRTRGLVEKLEKDVAMFATEMDRLGEEEARTLDLGGHEEDRPGE